MAGCGRKALFAAVVAGFALPAFAQNVPLPSGKPGTQPGTQTAQRTSKPISPPQSIAPPAQTQQPAQNQALPNPAPTNPFAALLGRGTTTALEPQQRAIIDRVSRYLSSIQTLTGKFVQVGPDGRRAEGQLYIQKPGKMRFEYDPPSPVELVADGQSVIVRDRNLATQDVYPLSQTPLRFLLADHIDLLKDTNLVAVYADDVFITVVVEEKSPLVGTSRLMIMFSAKDTQLKQWTVTDPQGFDTTVAVYNLDFNKRPDPSLFRIDYTRYRN